jgi:hypothetical protein
VIDRDMRDLRPPQLLRAVLLHALDAGVRDPDVEQRALGVVEPVEPVIDVAPHIRERLGDDWLWLGWRRREQLELARAGERQPVVRAERPLVEPDHALEPEPAPFDDPAVQKVDEAMVGLPGPLDRLLNRDVDVVHAACPPNGGLG